MKKIIEFIISTLGHRKQFEDEVRAELKVIKKNVLELKRDVLDLDFKISEKLSQE
jgi:hypothetical protein